MSDLDAKPDTLVWTDMPNSILVRMCQLITQIVVVISPDERWLVLTTGMGVISGLTLECV